MLSVWLLLLILLVWIVAVYTLMRGNSYAWICLIVTVIVALIQGVMVQMLFLNALLMEGMMKVYDIYDISSGCGVYIQTVTKESSARLICHQHNKNGDRNYMYLQSYEK